MPSAVKWGLQHENAFLIERHLAFKACLAEGSEIKSRLASHGHYISKRDVSRVLLKIGKVCLRKSLLLAFALTRKNDGMQQHWRFFGCGKFQKVVFCNVVIECQPEWEES